MLDCKDFATQRGAQAIFSRTPLSSNEDRFKLDRDGDGVACETPPNSTVAEDGTKLGADTGGDLDCMDFPSQKSAQTELRIHPSDPYNLDPENNGIACEMRPADYTVPAVDVTPVVKAQSKADLSCQDFEYQQEAQMIYLRDKSDPNDLDKGQNGSSVCENLPVLASNAEEIKAGNYFSMSSTAEKSSALPPLTALIQANDKVKILMDSVASLLITSGVLVIALVWWHRRFSRSR